MNAPHISLTGDVRVELPGRPIAGGSPALRSLQARTVLAVLVLERPRPVRRDELAEVLWPDDRPASWESVLRTAVARVRTALAEAGLDPRTTIRAAFGCYQMHLPDETVVDIERAATDVESAGNLPVTEAARLLARATRVTRLPLLPESDGEWVTRHRAGLRTIHARGLRALCAVEIAAGRIGEATAAAVELADLDQFDESAHRLLLTTLAENGNRAQALLTYERFRVLLATELGIAPSPETQAAYLDLLNLEQVSA
ncbi:DNA-binding SARP family transcriptional activator [Actinokineospora baliensis]|uniref:AfsR/SARP family transcriptional regulator n=1 Tax=Actinokineospora baliensis TaxID=547056 RepID=UPI001957EB2E|nr:BTAD domain-containing putative transcriptional regulator [Actinokineospora baliensis]MBM7774728.1 DNA-binding SARP family transcriptional activator [Actinokineospora baliensis]